MSLPQNIVLCITSSIDNLSVGVTLGISSKSVSFLSNAIISSMNAVVTLGTMLLGDLIAKVLNPDVASALGASIFIALGVKELLSYAYDVWEKKSTPAVDDGSYETLIEDTNKEGSVDGVFEYTSYFSGLWEQLHQEKRIRIDMKTTVILGLGLCFTNVAGGIAAGLNGYNIYITVIGVLVVSFVMLLSGEYLGVLFGSILPSFIVPIIAGVGLIVIGIVDMPGVSD